MAEKPAAEVQLLRQKVKLIEILRADANFVLQHAHSRSLLSDEGYERIQCRPVPSEKVTDLLDHIIQRGPGAAQGLLDLLKEPDFQKTFPMLDFVKDLNGNTVSLETNQRPAKKEEVSEVAVITPSKKMNCLVTEKQLMFVAREIGISWRAIGRQALDIPTVKLEQIEADNSHHVERVFAMLHYWCKIQREKATAAYLHYVLSQGVDALPPGSIDFLLQSDSEDQ